MLPWGTKPGNQRGLLTNGERHPQILKKVDFTRNFELSCFPQEGLPEKRGEFRVQNFGNGLQLTILDR